MDWLGAALLSVALAALPVRAEQGQRLGLGLAARARPHLRRPRRRRVLGVGGDEGRPAARGHARAAPPPRADDEHHRRPDRLLDVRLVPARPAARADAGAVRLRLRRHRHRRRAADAAEHARDARRRPVGRPAGDQVRLAPAARDRDRDRRGRVPVLRGRARDRVGDRDRRRAARRRDRVQLRVDGEPRRGVGAAATRSASPPASTRSCGRSAARSARSWWRAC